MSPFFSLALFSLLCCLLPKNLPVKGEAAGLVAEGEKALTCAFCGARNPLYFHYCFNCGLNLNQEKQEGEEGC